VATDWLAKVNETAQEHVPEPLVAAGILQPAGTWGAFGLDQVSGVAAMIKLRKVNKDAGGLSKSPRLTLPCFGAVYIRMRYVGGAKSTVRTSRCGRNGSSRRTSR
jgi:hypothetical protein